MLEVLCGCDVHERGEGIEFFHHSLDGAENQPLAIRLVLVDVGPLNVDDNLLEERVGRRQVALRLAILGETKFVFELANSRPP